MDKYIPYEKLSRKEKRKLDASRRNTWGSLNPVARKPENSKAYNRKKMQNWKKDLTSSACSLLRRRRSYYKCSKSLVEISGIEPLTS